MMNDKLFSSVNLAKNFILCKFSRNNFAHLLVNIYCSDLDDFEDFLTSKFPPNVTRCANFFVVDNTISEPMWTTASIAVN